MKRVRMDQQSEAWHVWRAGGLGGSDAPAIMGISKWQTRQQLLEYKAAHWGGGARKWGGLVRKNKSAAMERGIEKEPMVRALYVELTGIQVQPACVIHDTLPWLRASLDGLNVPTDTLMVEIKCPSNEDHRCALVGVVPTKYWAQVQHQLAIGVPQVEKLHYVSWTDSKVFSKWDQLKVVPVTPSKAYIEELIAEESRFIRDLETLTGRDFGLEYEEIEAAVEKIEN